MSEPAFLESHFIHCPRCATKLQRKRLKENEPERPVCPSCDYVAFFGPKVAAGVVFQLNGGIVLARRGIEPCMGMWVFPGGYVNHGESVPDAAIRETKEEIDVEVRLVELLDVYSYDGTPVVIIAFAAELVAGTPRPADETLEVRTFTRDEIPWDELAFSSTRDAVRAYIERFM